MGFYDPGSLVLLPPEDDARRGPLLDLSFELSQASARLGASVHPVLRRELGVLVRTMNCYYSNLIEGHNTLPRDIERAMENDFSAEPAKRDLQLEARAHIEVQAMIDVGGLDSFGLGRAFVRRLHKEFCGRLPDEFLSVTNPGVGGALTVSPGEWRTNEVVVGAHRPIDAPLVDTFMLRFDEGYDPKRVGTALGAIAAAASHHRLLWIHPFLDGNGRVARLHSHAYLRRVGIGSDLWSVSRGLARTVAKYREQLARADWPPQGASDGRGTLSDKNLAEFIRYFLETALDQIHFMSRLFDLPTLVERVQAFAAREAEAKRLDKRVGDVLERLAIVGEVKRDDLSRLLGVEARQARRLLEPLVKRKLIIADNLQGPLRLRFPIAEADAFFPRLFSQNIDEPDEKTGRAS